MIEVIKAAAELQSVCEAESWKFCFIGGLALQRWGEPRETVDVDLTVLTGFGGEAEFIRTLLEHFEGRLPDTAGFAVSNRVLLLKSRSDVGIDVALGALPFEEELIERSSLFTFPPGIPLRTCSAEDLIVMKAFADRGQDRVDVERIIVRQTGKLDWDYILRQIRPLAALKGSPEIVDNLLRRRQDFES